MPHIGSPLQYFHFSKAEYRQENQVAEMDLFVVAWENSLSFHQEIENYLKYHPEINLAFQPGTFR